MPIYIYNSLTRKKEEFIPLNPPQVNIYTCGITVYDETHIGHSRSLYIFDVIRRYLSCQGFEVRFVRNITDIDDKIINRSQELKIDWQELVKKYIDRYDEDLKTLGIQKADAEPRATENVDDMIRHIKALMDKGYAYLAGGDVYFNVKKFLEYGKLSGQNPEQMRQGIRIEPAEYKKDALDFALWKKTKPAEPFWESPWGRGRPGWHIECSVMSTKYLRTDTLDIHAGGRDLIFPHHENEIAQSEALTGKPLAKYWMHHGLLTINGQKMSKSQGNFVSIKDFISKYRYAEILKLFFLSCHYGHPIDYNEDRIEESKQALERILILLSKIDSQLLTFNPKLSTGEIAEIENIKQEFIQAMDDDFNMPEAQASIFTLINLTHKNINDLTFIYNAREAIKELLDIFGISLPPQKLITDITDDEIRERIRERDKVRQAKDYPLADEIRRELEEKGIILEDGESKTTWRRRL